MTVLLDANIIVAAFATRGLCKDVFEYCLNVYKIVASEPLLVEIEDAFAKKLKLPPPETKSILSFLQEHMFIVTPNKLLNPVCRDSSDDVILATARTGKADMIVSGDQDLLILRNFEGIPILSPRQFWEELRKKPRR